MPPLKPLFQTASVLALIGWLLLMALPGWAHTASVVVGVVVVLLAIIYAWVLFAALRQRPEPGSGKPGFFTLGGVLALLRNPTAALAAWIHILAFDLMVGLYIQQQGALQGIGHLWLVPCYLMAMMFGPLGLLLFLGVSLLH